MPWRIVAYDDRRSRIAQTLLENFEKTLPDEIQAHIDSTREDREEQLDWRDDARRLRTVVVDAIDLELENTREQREEDLAEQIEAQLREQFDEGVAEAIDDALQEEMA
jgi:hypothetical protein